MIIRFAVICLVIYVAYRVARRLLSRPSPRVDRRDADRIDDVMVKDPQCGVYFPLRDGVTLKRPDQELHFCSRECRDRYVRSEQSGQ